MAKQRYALGVGDLYILVADTVPETDADIETAANKIGSTSGGCTLSYEAETYEVIDDDNRKLDVFLTKEAVSFDGNILTWDLETLAKLTANATAETTGSKSTLRIGGGGNAIQRIVVRFVHKFKDGKKLRATLMGTSTGGFELTFERDKETIIPFSVSALNQADGTLCTIEMEV